MLFPSDCHVHTQFCDGSSTMERIAYRAHQMGYVTLGFSPHSSLPFRNDYAMKPAQELAYQKKVEELRRLYKGRMKIYMGIEWDYDTPYGCPQYDYRIGSVHQMRIGNRYYAIDLSPEELSECLTRVFNGRPEEYLRYYFSLVEASCVRVGVDVVGHIDLPMKFNGGHCRFFDENSALYHEMAINCIRRIVRRRPELIFEVNTGAMFRVGRQIPYPAPFILRELAKLRARITISSDAHSTEALAFWQEGAVDLCRRCGHRTIYRLAENGFQAFPLQ